MKWTIEQKKAIETIDGIVCLSAGPGCGKTFVLINRYLYILKILLNEKKLDIDEAVQKILAVTFTNKAADEMKERLAKNLETFEYKNRFLTEIEIERIISGVKVSTIDAWATNLLKENILNTNYEITNDFEIIQGFEAKEIFFKIGLESFDDISLNYIDKLETLQLGKSPKDILESAYKFIQNLKSRLIFPEIFLNITKKSLNKKETDEETFAVAEIIADLYKKFDKFLMKENYLTFSDLLVYVYKIFINYPDILKESCKDLDYILVDEYQDINDAQDLVLRMLSKAVKERKKCQLETENNIKENYFIVGDTGQSIYKFRNANYKQMLEYKTFEADFSLSLSNNFRSTKNIIGFINQYFCSDLLDNKENNKIYQKLLPNRDEEGEKVKIFLAENYEEDAEFIAEIIAKNVLKFGKYELKDIKILFKTKTNFLVYARALAKKNIPFVLVGGTEFIKREEVLFFLCLFRILANPNNDEANIVFLTHKLFGFSLDELVILKNLEILKIFDLDYSNGLKYVPIFEILNFVYKKLDLANKNNADLEEIFKNSTEKEFKIEILEKIKKYMDFLLNIFDFSLNSNENVLSNIFSFILKTDIVYLYFNNSKLENYAQNLDGIEKFKILINKYEKENIFGNVNGFLEFFKKMQDDEFKIFDVERLGDYNAVVLMTIHASKGLEFPVVFLAGLKDSTNKQDIFQFHKDKGFIIKYSSKKEKLEDGRVNYYKLFLEEENQVEHLGEEERVFYVGTTRSKNVLFISSIKEKRKIKGENKIKFSKLIDKILEEKEDSIFVVKDEFKSFVEIIYSFEKDINFLKEDIEEKENFLIQNIENNFKTLNLENILKSKIFYEDYIKDFSKINYQKKRYFYSVSELELFSKCETAYFLQREKKINNIFGLKNYEIKEDLFDLEEDFDSIEFGNAIHEFLYEKGLGFYKTDDVAKILKLKLEKKGIFYSKEYEMRIEKFLIWLKKYNFENKNIFEVEKNFVWKVGDFFIRGTVDRIDKIEENKFAILDYKTSQKIIDFGDSEYKNFELTMNIYKYALEEVYGLNIDSMKLVYPLCNKEIFIEKKPKEFIKQKILDFVQKINNKDFCFDNLKNKKICSFCDFKSFC